MASPSRQSTAQASRRRLLTVASQAIAQHGTDASLRDIARRAGVGIGTLYRHFPTRDALIEELTRERFAALQVRAQELLEHPPLEALILWLREFATSAATTNGLPNTVLAALRDETSALHLACTGMRSAGAQLLRRAQDAGVVRPDLTPNDVLSMVAGVAWAGDYADDKDARLDRLFRVIESGISVPG